MDRKPCSVCKQTKPLEEFYRDRTGPNGHKSACKECQRAHQRAAYKNRGLSPPKPKQNIKRVFSCSQCGKEFQDSASRSRRYCSRGCHHQSMSMQQKVHGSYTFEAAGVHYKVALPEEKWREMQAFLQNLAHYSEVAQKSGAQPDVSAFMQEYIAIKQGE